MRLALRTAGIGLVLVICSAAAPGAFAQTPGTDVDRCPGVEGTVSGCPDSDGDGFADLDDKCPTVGDRHAPDYFLDGCPDAVFDVRYLLQTRERCTPTQRVNFKCPLETREEYRDGHTRLYRQAGQFRSADRLPPAATQSLSQLQQPLVGEPAQ